MRVRFRSIDPAIRIDFRLWHKCDIARRARHVRFRGRSGRAANGGRGPSLTQTCRRSDASAWARMDAICLLYQRLYDLPRTFDEQLRRWIQGAVLEGNDRSRPGCYGKVDRQNLERGAHRAEVHEGFWQKSHVAPGRQQTIPQM